MSMITGLRKQRSDLKGKVLNIGKSISLKDVTINEMTNYYTNAILNNILSYRRTYRRLSHNYCITNNKLLHKPCIFFFIK